MQQISSASVCNFFYAFFIIYAVLFLVAVVASIGTFISMKKVDGMAIGLLVQTVITSLIAGSFMLSYYIMCDRALLTAKAIENFKNEKKH